MILNPGLLEFVSLITSKVLKVMVLGLESGKRKVIRFVNLNIGICLVSNVLDCRKFQRLTGV